MHAGPAAAIHSRTHHDLAWLYALGKQRVNAIFSGVVSVRTPCWRAQRRLVAENGVAPAAVEVIAHQEDVVEVLLSGSVIHVFDLIAACTDGAGQFIGTARLCRQLVQHGAQVVHQRGIGRFILLRIAQVFAHTAAAREFPVDIHAVKEFPGLEELFHRRDKACADSRVTHVEEGIGERPAADRWQHFQVRMRFFQRHQLAKVTFIRVVPAGDASLWFLQRSPWVVDRHGIVRTALTVVLEHAEAVAAFNGFQAVVDAVTATDWNEAVKNVVEVCRRDLINREVTVINAPLREVGRNHFIGMLRKRFVILFERRIQRQQVATVGVCHNNQLAGAFRTAAGVTDFNLFLITPAFFHFKRCRARRAGCAGPYGLSVQQNFR